MIDYNDNEEFWVKVYNWVAEWFFVCGVYSGINI